LIPVGLAAALFVIANGCAPWLASAVIYVPNTGRTIDPANDPVPVELACLGVTQQFRVATGPPDASLSTWGLDPERDLAGAAPNWTPVILHGLNDGKDSMLAFGRAVARAGHRAVLVDLRGRGRSGGRYASIDVRDGADSGPGA